MSSETLEINMEECYYEPHMFSDYKENNHPEYFRKLAPIVLNGTYEDFLSVYIPGKANDFEHFFAACTYGRLDIAQYIHANVNNLPIRGIDADCSEDPLFFAIFNNHEHVVRWLLSLDGISVNDKNWYGYDYTPLQYAVAKNFSSDIIMRMVDLGAKLNLTTMLYDDDHHPLLHAISNNRMDLVIYFLISGYNPYNPTVFNVTGITSEATSLLYNYQSVMLKYCFDQTGTTISADDLAFIAEMAKLDPPQNLEPAWGESDDE
jgi:hypothetical protein